MKQPIANFLYKAQKGFKGNKNNIDFKFLKRDCKKEIIGEKDSAMKKKKNNAEPDKSGFYNLNR